MRPVLALLLTIGLIGGISAYIQFARSVRRPPIEFQAETSVDRFEVELTRTFDCVADPIAELKSIEVRFRDQELFASDAPVKSTETIRFAIPRDVEIGDNEISVAANRDFLATEFAAIGVTLYQNDVAIRRQTITSEPDLSTVSGSVVFRVSQEHDHE
ncbi:MAG: hypothetical protein AAFN77_21980 [Planctomycetota bacterium]